jgi:hypothetical protein
MITEKNKEEIEKIEQLLKKLEKLGTKKKGHVCGEDFEYLEFPSVNQARFHVQLQERRKATIKTSIEWCEDEILKNCHEQNDLSYIVGYLSQSDNSSIVELIETRLENIKKDYKQLTIYLEWLKQKEIN